jgi:hypothetical protein
LALQDTLEENEDTEAVDGDTDERDDPVDVRVRSPAYLSISKANKPSRRHGVEDEVEWFVRTKHEQSDWKEE